ncbi:hypothetical protein U6B65_01015 [Oscillospiraceae bacterium MB08-C2-2]|nr:hypothetical protein U6B65_01015 [Oscillospiraceae bacterium MB08-C2-2]
MHIFVSTAMYDYETTLEAMELVESVISQYDGRVGMDIPLLVHSPEYQRMLQQKIPDLRPYPISVKSPYLGSEIIAPKGTTEHHKLIKNCTYAFFMARMLGSPTLTLRTQDQIVSPDSQQSLNPNVFENLEALSYLGRQCNITLNIENAGGNSECCPMFNADDFIELFENFPEIDCVLDIERCIKEKWNLPHIVSTLEDCIVAYRLCNLGNPEDPFALSGRNLEQFFNLYRIYTPDASLILEYDYKPGCTSLDLRHSIETLIQGIGRIPDPISPFRNAHAGMRWALQKV